MEAIGEDWTIDLSQSRPYSDVSTGYSFFEEGDILIARVTPCFENGKAAIARGLEHAAGFGTTEITVVRSSDRLDTRFLFYALNEDRFKQLGISEMTGAGGLKRVPDRAIKDFRLATPGIEEQALIADYLDTETAEIDAFIRDQEDLIRLLSERRTATINQAVTKGLNATASVRRSGNEDCSFIPEHWIVAPLKAVASLQTGITLGKDYPHGVELPYLRVANVQAGHIDLVDVKTVRVPPEVAARTTLRDRDVLMTEGGDRDKLGRGSLWRAQIDPCLHQNHVFAVRCKPGKLHPEFLAFVLEAAWARRYFESTAKQSTNLASTNSTLVKNFAFPVPPFEEQMHIAEALEWETAEIDGSIADAREAIALSRERRAALISAALTGQIDVRERVKGA